MSWTVMDAFNTYGATRSCGGEQELYMLRQTDAIATLITGLGYAVKCGEDTEYYTVEQHLSLISSYVILSIMRPSGEYVYGMALTPSESGVNAWIDGDPPVSHVKLTENWPLLRTDTRRKGLSIPETIILAADSKLSTIGNSLPSDIVAALKQHPLSYPLPSWEFYPQTLDTCPVAEESEYEQVYEQGGNAAEAEVCGAKKEMIESDSSSEDDD